MVFVDSELLIIDDPRKKKKFSLKEGELLSTENASIAYSMLLGSGICYQIVE